MKLKLGPIKKYFQDIFNPVVKAERGVEQQRFLSTDLEYSYGLRSPLINPDSTLLDKSKDLTLYDLMLKDDRIKSVLEIFKRMVTSVGGSFVSPSKEPADEEMTQFVEKSFNSLKGIRFWDVFDNLLDARVYGFKAGELIWEVVDGKMVVADIKFCHPIFFDFNYDDFRNIKDVRIGYTIGKSAFVTPEEWARKFIYFCNPYVKDGNHYGTSELSDIYEQWYAKKYISKFRSMYLQNYGFPIPVGVYDQTAFKASEKTALEKSFETFQEMQYFLFPGRRAQDGSLKSNVEIQFHKAETTGGAESFNATIDILDKQIARKLLIPDKMGFSESDGGSYAMAETQFDALKMFIRDYQGRLEDCINKVVRMVVDFNFANVEKYPEFKFESSDQRLSETMLKLLFDAGVVDKREKWIRNYVGIPEITPEEQAEIDALKAKEPKPPMFPGFPPRDVEDESDDKEPKEEFKQNPYFDKTEMEKVYDRFEADFISEYKKIMFGLTSSVVGQIKQSRMLDEKNLAGLKSLRMTRAKTEMKDLFSTYFAKLYLNGKTDAIDQVKGRLKKAEKQLMKEYEQFKPADDELWIDREWVDKYLKAYGELGELTKEDRQYLKNYRQQAFYITGETEAEVLKTAEKVISSGLRNGLTTENIVLKLEEALGEMASSRALTIARTNASEAYNSGRMNEFMSDGVREFIEAYQFMAIVDDATTDICRGLDGRILYPGDSDFAQYVPPLHYNCRSMLVPIFIGESEQSGNYYRDYADKLKPIDRNIRPAQGFGG